MLAERMGTRPLSSWASGAPALLLVTALAAVTLTEAMYRLSPAYGAAILLAPVIAGVIAWKPLLGVYGSLLAIPLETSGPSY
jgi:hypothetical protein